MKFGTRTNNHQFAFTLAEVLAALLFMAVVIPVAARHNVAAVSNRLRVERSGWDSTFWALQNWYHEG